VKRTSKTMSLLTATAALSIGSHNSIAGQCQTGPTAFVGISELDLQVLLDRAGFSPDKSLTALRQAGGFPAGAKDRKLLLTTLGAGAIDPVVPHAITAEEAAGPFSATIPPDMLGQSKLPGLYYTFVLQKISEEFHSAPGADMAGEPGSKCIGHHGRVGDAQSHGCVRLTNWDALELAALVRRGSPVVFEQ
jgi:hypothetical protein